MPSDLSDLRNQLLPVGVTAGGQYDNRSKPRLLPLNVPASSLHELASEYVFWTAVVPSKVVPDARSLPVLYQDSSNKDLVIHTLQLPVPLIDGLGTSADACDWARTLFLTPRDQWLDFEKFVGTVAFFDKNGAFWRLRWQVQHIADPGRPLGSLKSVPLRSVAVESTLGDFFLRQASQVIGGTALPLVFSHVTTPNPETVRMAQAIRAGSSDPYGANPCL